jgi:hypothetical protein
MPKIDVTQKLTLADFVRIASEVGDGMGSADESHRAA